MDDMTGRFGIGTMNAVFQVVGTVFVEKHALNITTTKQTKKKQKNVCVLVMWLFSQWVT